MDTRELQRRKDIAALKERCRQRMLEAENIAIDVYNAALDAGANDVEAAAAADAMIEIAADECKKDRKETLRRWGG